ncbi:hypothetical protein N7540_011799 [Penicillium herquei]|nr:hypothetical protein N7540_011799 [Penicillium herquei]
MRGNYAESIRHLQAGSRLLDPQYLASLFSRSMTQSQQDIEFYRTCIIADMIRRLGMDISIFVGREVVSLPEISSFTVFNLLKLEDSVSQPFTSIAEAQDYLKTLDVFHEMKLLGIEDIGSHAYKATQPNYNTALAWVSPDHNIAYRAHRHRYKGWTSRFNDHIDGLFARLSPKQELQDAWALGLQKMIWDATARPPSDISNETFEAIINQATLLAISGAFTSQPVFAFDADIIPPVVFVFSYCNNFNLRLRSVDLLRSMNRREGMWDSSEIAELCGAALEGKLNGGRNSINDGCIVRLAQELNSLGIFGPKLINSTRDLRI